MPEITLNFSKAHFIALFFFVLRNPLKTVLCRESQLCKAVKYLLSKYL